MKPKEYKENKINKESKVTNKEARETNKELKETSKNVRIIAQLAEQLDDEKRQFGAYPKNCVNDHKMVEIPRERKWSWHERRKRKKRILSTNCWIISTSEG